MNISVIGISHKTAPIGIREKFYLTPTEQELFLSELKNNPRLVEAFILSTCNRTEVYCHTIDMGIDITLIVNLISTIKKNKLDGPFEKYFYIYNAQEAVEHLLKVISGLDSLVLGEKQILGQVKAAIDQARLKGMFTRYFNLLAAIAVRAGKKVQTETDIGFGGSSVSWAAVAMAEKVLGSLEDKSVLILGAGEMSKLAVGQISNKKFKKLYVMNRTPCHAQALAEKFNGIAVSFCDIKEILSQVDVCICSASAPHYILDKETVEKIMPERNARKLIFIDISMPRNIDPRVAEAPNVLLFEIDDLDKVVEESMEKRQAAVVQVQKIIDAKLKEFTRKMAKITSLRNTDYYQAAHAV